MSMFKRRKIQLLVALILLLFVQNCTSSKMAMSKSDKMKEPVSYSKQLLPIMEKSCTPCHWPEKGKKELLNSYAKTKMHIDDIIERTSKDPNEKGFMPFKSKRTPLTAKEVQLFKDWADQGYYE